MVRVDTDPADAILGTLNGSSTVAEVGVACLSAPSSGRRVTGPDAAPAVHRDQCAADADADAVCGAEYGMTSPERVNSRNGYRHRDLDTGIGIGIGIGIGTIDVAIPKLRQGSYFPDWLLERRLLRAQVPHHCQRQPEPPRLRQ
jgi:hypothetical protein